MKPGDLVRCSNSRRWGDSLLLVLEVYRDEANSLTLSRAAALLLNWTGTMWVRLDELEVVNETR